MHLSIDFGGSTIDTIVWRKRSVKVRSFERWPDFKDVSVAEVLKKMPKLKKLSSERLNTDESNSAC